MMKMLQYLDDGLVLVGCGLILVGTWAVCPVATWFVGGVMCILAGLLVGKVKARQ
jgi:hypothetical protein